MILPGQTIAPVSPPFKSAALATARALPICNNNRKHSVSANTSQEGQKLL